MKWLQAVWQKGIHCDGCLPPPTRVKVAKEMRIPSAAVAALHLQVDHILVERLQTTWPKGLLSGAREAAADYAHKTDEHDAAQKRYLGHK